MRLGDEQRWIKAEEIDAARLVFDATTNVDVIDDRYCRFLSDGSVEGLTVFGEF